MPGAIDDVIGASHDEDIAVFVDDAGIGRLIVAGELIEARSPKALIGIPEGNEAARGRGSFATMFPSVPGATGCPASTSTSSP